LIITLFVREIANHQRHRSARSPLAAAVWLDAPEKSPYFLARPRDRPALEAGIALGSEEIEDA